MSSSFNITKDLEASFLWKRCQQTFEITIFYHSGFRMNVILPEFIFSSLNFFFFFKINAIPFCDLYPGKRRYFFEFWYTFSIFTGN